MKYIKYEANLLSRTWMFRVFQKSDTETARGTLTHAFHVRTQVEHAKSMSNMYRACIMYELCDMPDMERGADLVRSCFID